MSFVAMTDLQWYSARLDRVAALLTSREPPKRRFLRSSPPPPAPDAAFLDGILAEDVLAAFVVALFSDACVLSAEEVAERFARRHGGEYRLAVDSFLDSLLWFDPLQFETALTMIGGAEALLALLDALAAHGGMLPPLATGMMVAGAQGLRRRAADAAVIVQYAAAHVGFPLVSGPPPPHGAYARANARAGIGRVRIEDTPI